MSISISSSRVADRIVLVSGDTSVTDLVTGALSAGNSGAQLERLTTVVELTKALGAGLDLVLFDANCPSCGLPEVLALLKTARGEVPLILISTQERAEDAVEAIRQGAENFVFKDRIARLEPAIWQARHNREQRRQHGLTTQSLQSSERLLRMTGRIARVGGWSYDVEKDELEWTEETRRIHEVAPDYVPKVDTAIEFYAPKARGQIRQAVERAMTEGTSWDLELPLMTATGRDIWVRAKGEVVSKHGCVTHLVGAFQEITDRKSVEEKMVQQAALLDMAPDAIVLRDLNHRILFWSKGAELIYGWTAGEAQGRDFRDIAGLEKPRLDEIEKAVRANDTWQGELRREIEGGDFLMLDCHWTFLKDPEGWPASILSIDTDVTDRKKLETQFLRAQRMESIGTLAGGIAHDLNNILSPILMAGDLLRQHVQSETGLRLLDNLGNSARRGADLVKQVLSFARGVEGARVSVQVRHIVREIEDIVTNTFPKNITVETDIPHGLPLIIGDPTQINQVLVNLSVNARDAMPDGGRLSISASQVELDSQYVAMNHGTAPGRYVMISISDQGVGMAGQVLEHIFEPFFTTKETGKGTGLGLSTVQAIMRSHGGFVNVYSEPRKGTVFKIYFPVSTELVVDGLDREPAIEIPRGRGELVLLVDDEVSILSVTRQTLQSFGYKVVVAEDGAAAIGIYAQQAAKIDLVLTDMMMPIMDGPTLIGALRRINPMVKVIASSGLASAGGANKAANVKVSHFLPKPYSATTMLRMVRQAIDG